MPRDYELGISRRSYFVALNYEGLLLAIIEQAVMDARRGDRGARRWLAGETDEPVISYRECCEWLGLSYDIARRWPR